MVYSKENLAVLGVSLFLAASSINAQFVPLAQKRFNYTNIPYKVDTDVGLPRGLQKGYNICNETTENQESLCQTAFINSLDDFCLWAPPEPGEDVGNIEGEMVAWCTKKGHGTRVMPKGTITGVQFTKTPDYIQVVGFMDQTKINMKPGDSGGEMDPHGADLRGNPIGGLLFTSAWTGSYVQAVEWHNFNGNDMFCLKACDPRGPRAARLCEHIYDVMGCGFNAPSNAKLGVFESCESESQDPPGQYVNAAGVTTTWKQGDGTVPYSVRIPRSTSCSTFRSESIFDGTETVPVPGATAAATTTGGNPAATSSGSSTSSTSRTDSSSSSSASQTRTSGSAQNTDGPSSDAIIGRRMSAGLGLFGLAVSFVALF
ncbi:hypothetical protein JR316_0005534 [Psilocybe cubensis]|uniref:Macrofage activating glycoprotein n=2 Tax=Psilocybe cubensis TaxID=181762 RepID=A0A8H7XXY3_PSICU|nr:hypothetical protein JR316_0005534 [Psilocybe cubensis]KAH9481016.1 hypothetical protein JR316_0005534 [Psilocybe cubensis]